MATKLRLDVIPGAAVPLDLTVTNAATGLPVDLTGATVEATARAGSDDPTAIVPTQTSTNVWQVLVGAGITSPNPGRQLRVRAWVTPAASVETTAIEALINVAAA